MSDDASARLLMGKIGAAHGIKGEVKVTSYTEDPLGLAEYGPLSTNRPGLRIEIASLRPIGSGLVARLKGVADRTAAERLNGVELYVDRDKLPQIEGDDDFYQADLIGLEARLSSGTVIGRVTAVPNYGAGDLVEVRDPTSGDTFLYPFTRAAVPEVHVKQGYLVIDPPVDADPGDEEPD